MSSSLHHQARRNRSNKIKAADLFVADVSIAYEFSRLDSESIKKYAPNPNVMLELGYAAHCIGWDRIICICNTTYGFNMPFDLGKRRILTYEYNGIDQERSKAKEVLKSKLLDAIKGILQVVPPKYLPLEYTYHRLDSFMQAAQALVDASNWHTSMKDEYPYHDVYCGPADQSPMKVPISALEDRIAQSRVEIVGLGSLPFMTQHPNYVEVFREKDGLIVHGKEFKISVPWWKADRAGMIFQRDWTFELGEAPNLVMVEYILKTICEPLIFVKKFVGDWQGQYKFEYKWYRTKNKVLSFKNMANFSRYAGYRQCTNETVHIECELDLRQDISLVIYQLFDEVAHQFNRPDINREHIEPLVKSILTDLKLA